MERCTFGHRTPINRDMLDEIVNREVKHFRNYKTYRPNFSVVPVATKFHTRYVEKDTDELNRKVEIYFDQVTQARALGPHTKYPLPVTTSHEYGWYLEPIYPVDRNDRRFYKPKIESENTKMFTRNLLSNPRSRKAKAF